MENPLAAALNQALLEELNVVLRWDLAAALVAPKGLRARHTRAILAEAHLEELADYIEGLVHRVRQELPPALPWLEDGVLFDGVRLPASNRFDFDTWRLWLEHVTPEVGAHIKRLWSASPWALAQSFQKLQLTAFVFRFRNRYDPDPVANLRAFLTEGAAANRIAERLQTLAEILRDPERAAHHAGAARALAFFHVLHHRWSVWRERQPPAVAHRLRRPA